ncbi:ArsR/SmtB family transcription factor [Halanaerobacter jeridensis]|uniref:DNA-binding transcriptional ArsR family regulator n=1 Tax=Halanaerobacter jeridensis TaxID=706427 RepID=A0A938XR40_9FIRM|nr:metalloregulator ArsR/SmtB family transcription factor [Halanaerobacter jeridensis]MBM7558042.1 DNA-binding transcriptional ArsR family regulator [Halanaerobacter jeridensis]
MEDKDLLVCEEYCPNLKRIEEVKSEELTDDVIERLADTFKVLSDPTRIKILNALANKELCVCDISELLDMSQSAISHQLRKLRDLKLVKHRKEGRTVYYSLDDYHIFQLFSQGLAHVLEDKK